MIELRFETSHQVQMLDITRQVEQVVQANKLLAGLCVVFVPHTTAGITINENADPAVCADMLMVLNKMVPQADGYQHSEGNAAAHIKASLMGNSVTVLVENSVLQLGTWQGIYLCEFDGPRMRKVWVTQH